MTPTPQAQVTEEAVRAVCAADGQDYDVLLETYNGRQRITDYRRFALAALSTPPARQDVEELIAALEPFAQAAKFYDDWTADDIQIDRNGVGITAGDLRRAAQALARVRGEKE